MNQLMKMLSNSEKFNSYIDDIKKTKSPSLLTGLTDVMKAYFSYATSQYVDKKICIITYNEIQARNIVKNLEFFTDKVVFVPKKEIVTYDYLVESKDLPYERIDSLNKIKQQKAQIVVTTIETMMQVMISEDVLYKHIMEFKVGNTYSLEQIKQDLVYLGYTRCDLIEAKGQFSLRGGILDIALNEKKGIRIEFWGDEIDSIRYFNIISQRSTDMCKEITIYPAHEFVLELPLEEVVQNIKKRENIQFEENIKQDIEQILNGGHISKIDKYFNSFYKKSSTLLDYIKEDFIICIDEIAKIKARAKNALIDNKNIQEMLTDKEKMIPDVTLNMLDYDTVFEKIGNRKTIYLEKQDIISQSEENLQLKHKKIHFLTREINYYKSSMEVFLEDIQKAINEEKTVIVLGGSEESSRKLSLLLLEKEIPHKYLENLNYNLPKNIVIVTKGSLESGFEYYDINLLVISSKELFNIDTKKRRKSHTAFSEGEKVVFADLKRRGLCCS